MPDTRRTTEAPDFSLDRSAGMIPVALQQMSLRDGSWSELFVGFR